jgi:hypothetical protein
MTDLWPHATKFEWEEPKKFDVTEKPEIFYGALRDIKEKCYNPFHPKYPLYGGLGIHVCNRWLIKSKDFYYDMSPKEVGAGIRRLNKEDHFHPGNCLWGRAPKTPKQKNDSKKVLSAIGKYKFGIDWLSEFDDWDKFKFVYKRVLHLGIPDNDIILAKKYIMHLYNDPRFSLLYDKWLDSGKEANKMPSIDHMTPISKGGTSNLWNLRWVTFFENRAKSAILQEEWDSIKENISEYFI